MSKKMILSLINDVSLLKKDDLIKRMLVFIEKEYDVVVAFLEYEDVFPRLYYLDDDFLIKTHKYNFIPEKSTKLEVIIDLLPFKENDYFEDDFIYLKIPINFQDRNMGELIAKVKNMEIFSENKDLIAKISLEIAFMLDYSELKLLKNDAIESLIVETQLNQKLENNINMIKEELDLLKNNNDFGIMVIDLELRILEVNEYIKNILQINDKNQKMSKFLTQNEIHSSNFIDYLKKLAETNISSVTNISLINELGREFYFKVSGKYLKSKNYFFLKFFNTTSEMIVTKKFANIKNKFNQLVKAEINDVIKTSDLVMLETLKFFENKDEDFGNHLERISQYSLIIANDIFDNNTLNEDIDQDYLDVLPRAAALHDIGMLSIKESILFKDSKFTEEEFLIVKNHTIVAAKMIDKLIIDYPNSMFLKLLKEITLGHHERYDGSGYPYHLKGKQIPLSSRIVALADIFDGLTTDRIYKKGLDLDIARMMIVDYSNKLIDPDIVDIYLRNENKFIKIHKKYNLS